MIEGSISSSCSLKLDKEMLNFYHPNKKKKKNLPNKTKCDSSFNVSSALFFWFESLYV